LVFLYQEERCDYEKGQRVYVITNLSHTDLKDNENRVKYYREKPGEEEKSQKWYSTGRGVCCTGENYPEI
jgi:hypothetical protein